LVNLTMKKNIKTGILAALLVLPVLLLLTLYKFGNNHFKVAVYHAYDSTLVDGKYVITDVHHIPDFNFIDQNGKMIGNKDLLGSIYVADFFFSRCTGICKDMSSQLVRVQEEFKEDNIVKIVSFTVDPEYDNAQILKQYAKAYRAINGKWNFVTGSKDSLYSLAKKGFFLNALEVADNKEDFIHDNHFVLVDKEGRIRGYYDGTDKKDVDRLIMEIGVLVHEYDGEE
jgi:protein SCO1